MTPIATFYFDAHYTDGIGARMGRLTGHLSVESLVTIAQALAKDSGRNGCVRVRDASGTTILTAWSGAWTQGHAPISGRAAAEQFLNRAAAKRRSSSAS
jgi:hypothetical protein